MSCKIETPGLSEGYEKFSCMCSRIEENKSGANIMGHPVCSVLGIEARVVKAAINYLAVKAAAISMPVC